MTRRRRLSPVEEANALEHAVWWSAAIDHEFCDQCRPAALALAALLGRAIRVIWLLRGVGDGTPEGEQ